MTKWKNSWILFSTLCFDYILTTQTTVKFSLISCFQKILLTLKALIQVIWKILVDKISGQELHKYGLINIDFDPPVRSRPCWCVPAECGYKSPSLGPTLSPCNRKHHWQPVSHHIAHTALPPHDPLTRVYKHHCGCPTLWVWHP